MFGVATLVIVAAVYFALYSRKRLVADSPEEYAALTKAKHVVYDMGAD